jgi:predicted acylesterase/phospholipase RssA
VHTVWILRESKEFPHPGEIGLAIARRDFKVILTPTEGAISDRQQRSLARLVHHLQGRRLGLALGGGGARGLAHLGVLRALERAGIYFDHIAGTSVGALMGLSYCAGWSPDQALIDFKRDLTPGWLFRALPRGNHWHMLAKFRLGAWDRMLRHYVADVTLEQLEIPLSTVAVDLVAARQVVRHEGDAIHAVLESINLPVISRPILRDGMALVDGGILNNLPANVLIDEGADFVVAVDIAAGIKSEFAGNTPTTPVEEMRRPGTLETIMRVNDIQDFHVTATQAHVADHIIGINTSGFAFSDFTRAFELAELGEATTEEAIPALKELLAEHRRR